MDPVQHEMGASTYGDALEGRRNVELEVYHCVGSFSFRSARGV